MFRVALVIAVMLLGALAGCRAVSPTRVANDLDEAIAAEPRMIAGIEEGHADLQPVVFLNEAADSDSAVGPAATPESLPLARPSAQPNTPLSLDDFAPRALGFIGVD